MNCPLSSNLIGLIGEAIDDCFFTGEGNIDYGNGIAVSAEWVDSKNAGYSVIHITISQNGTPKFSFDDYGTECHN